MTEPKGQKGGGSAEAEDPQIPDPSDEDQLALLPDLFRRALTLGLSGIFTTETAFRRALGDTLPRDWVDFAVDQSDRTRAQFVEKLASEIAGVLEAMDVDEIIRRTLAEHKVEVKAEIRLVPEAEKGRKDLGSMRVTMAGGGKRK